MTDSLTNAVQDADADEDVGGELPRESKNYLTPSGYRTMLDELEYLWRTERPC